MKGFGSAQFDRRSYPRLDFSLPLAFQAQEKSKLPAGISANISLGGLMAYLPLTVVKGQIIEVTMLLPLGEEKKTCKVQAEVVWAQNGQFEGGWVCRAGLRFFNMPSDSEEIWRQFLTEWQGEKNE